MKQQVRIGLALLAVAAFAVMAMFNHEPALFRLWGKHQWNVPLTFLLAIAFVTGIALAIAYIYLGYVADALDRRLFQWEPRARRRARALLRKGRAAMDKGEDKKAHEYFLKAQRRDPRFGEAFHAMAEWMKHSGRHDEALAQARKAVALNPENKASLELLAKYAQDAGEAGRAADTIVQLAEAEPNSKKVIKILPMTLANAGRWEEALEAQKKLLSNLPKELREDAREVQRGIKTELARAIRESQPDRAQKLLKEVVKESPAFVPAVALYSQILAEEDRRKDAARILLKAFNERPGVELYETMVEVLRDQSQDEMEIAVIAALDNSPRSHALRLAHARYYLLRGETERAGEELEKISGRPDAATLVLRAFAARRLQSEDADEAEISAVKAIEIEHTCSSCGRRNPAWEPRCPDCGLWNTLVTD